MLPYLFFNFALFCSFFFFIFFFALKYQRNSLQYIQKMQFSVKIFKALNNFIDCFLFLLIVFYLYYFFNCFFCLLYWSIDLFRIFLFFLLYFYECSRWSIILGFYYILFSFAMIFQFYSFNNFFIFLFFIQGALALFSARLLYLVREYIFTRIKYCNASNRCL